MSDYYKEILKLQRANPNAREAVNQWLQENIDADCDSLQSIALDEGELIKFYFGEEWDEDEDTKSDQIHSTKQEIYKLLVPIAKLAMPNRLSDEVTEDPEYDAELAAHEGEDEDDPPKPPRERNSPRPDARLNAIATLLNNNLTEDRVRFIVKDELARIFNKAIS